MIKTQTRIFSILFLVIGSITAPQVLALDISLVDPSEAPQGTLGQEVNIYGSDFDRKTQVEFLLNGQPSEDILVRSKSLKAPGWIVAVIDISADAQAETDYTLQLANRRGGKGTTTYATAKFKVTGKPMELVNCEDVFTDVAASECDCKFNKKDEGGQGTPSAWLWVLQNSCTTSATLTFPQYEVLNGNDHELRAIPGSGGAFRGSSVLANTGHRTHVFSLNISVDEAITNIGCSADDSKLNSAISFVLDDTKEHPEESTDKDGRIYELTRLRAWGINVESETPLCEAIVFHRDASYENLLVNLTHPPEYYTDAVVLVSDVSIMSGSFSKTGIQVSGFVNSGQSGRHVDKIGIQDSTIITTGGTVDGALRFGPIDGPGTVAQNLIGASGGTGISVEGGDGFDAPRIENNNVTGANIAIRADENVDEVYFKSNVLEGPGSHGIRTWAVDNTYRSNRFSKFGCDVEEYGSCQQ